MAADSWGAYDGNDKWSLTAVSTADDKTIVRLVADPITGALLVSLASTGVTVLVPTGTVNGSNTTFVFPSAPSLIVLDNGNIMNQTSSDGTVNWTGTTTVVLNQAPNFNIFGL
jgi:hypothetical protein